MTKKISILAVLIAFIALLVVVLQPLQRRGFSVVTKQTALDRVLQSGIIRCGYVSWYPYFTRDLKSGEPSGINYEIMSAIGRELGLNIVWSEEVGWGNLGEGIKTGRYDMVCTSMWPDAGKIKNFTLSHPMFYSQLYPFVRAGDHRFDGNVDRIDAGDVRIAAIDGAMSYHLAQDLFPRAQIAALPPMVGNAEFVMSVADGKADVVIVDKDENKKFLEANPGKLVQVPHVAPVKVFPHVLMFGAEDDTLASKVNFALQLMVDNGVISRILGRYSNNYLTVTPGYQGGENR